MPIVGNTDIKIPIPKFYDLIRSFFRSTSRLAYQLFVRPRGFDTLADHTCDSGFRFSPDICNSDLVEITYEYYFERMDIHYVIAFFLALNRNPTIGSRSTIAMSMKKVMGPEQPWHDARNGESRIAKNLQDDLA
uniref:NAD(P)-bd_dom domain-containing protein n=1 Tax=Heterorhabditis bacteriophora TaxID=37862 RepID=A0A1I7WNJ6_HETBA